MSIWIINLIIGAVFGLIFGIIAVNTMNDFFIDGEDGQESAELRWGWLLIVIFIIICAGASFASRGILAAVLIVLAILSVLNKEGKCVGATLLAIGFPFMVLVIAKTIEGVIEKKGADVSDFLWLVPILVFALSDLIKAHLVEMRELRELEIEAATGEKPKRDWIPGLVGAIIVVAAIVATFVFILERGWFA